MSIDARHSAAQVADISTSKQASQELGSRAVRDALVSAILKVDPKSTTPAEDAKLLGWITQAPIRAEERFALIIPLLPRLTEPRLRLQAVRAALDCKRGQDKSTIAQLEQEFAQLKASQ